MAWGGGCLTTRRQRIARRQLIGIAGLAADRLRSALPGGVDGAHEAGGAPAAQPAAYVSAWFDDPVALRSPAHEDGPGSLGAARAAWSRCRPRAAVDPHLDVTLPGTDQPGRRVVRANAAPDPDEVVVTRMSTGAAFVFHPRRSLPITPV